MPCTRKKAHIYGFFTFLISALGVVLVTAFFFFPVTSVQSGIQSGILALEAHNTLALFQSSEPSVPMKALLWEWTLPDNM